jgi:hypothetical protein
MDRLKQFGESMVGGTILGAAAPELTMGAGAAIGAIPSPYTRAVGTGLQSAGRAMRGERGLAAAGGALSGGTGDIAGQFAQARGAGTLGTFAAELAGGIAGPAFINTISEAVKYFTSLKSASFKLAAFRKTFPLIELAEPRAFAL